MSEFSEIQPALQGGRLSQPISVESGRDLAACFRNGRNHGAKVELFFALAENNPEVAVPAFAEILETKASPPMRALALQGLGRTSQKYPKIKQALASCETDEDLQVLRDVAQEVKGKGEVNSDLTRWAAAWAIEAIGFLPDAIEHLQGGALTDPPYRIQNEIINRKLQEINQIQRFDSRGKLTAEYERHLEFWLYGPTQELFRENSRSRNYEDIVYDVIDKLHIRGVDLAVDKDNRLETVNPQKKRGLQEAALRIAEQIFIDESTEVEQTRLYEILDQFLENNYNQDIPLRRLAAVAICNAGSCLPPSARARTVIICERWQEVEALGEPAISHLEEVIERKLRLATHESEIINQQVKAVETISRIQFADFSQKLRVLAKVLLRPEEKVRNAAARLLAQHKSRVDQDVANLLEALLLKYGLHEPDSRDLTIPGMEKLIRASRQYQSLISTTFLTAIDAVDSLSRRYAQSASAVKQFLRDKSEGYLSNVESWIERQLNSIEYKLPNLLLKDMTLAEMDDAIRSLEQEKSCLRVTFSAAIETSESSSGIYDCTNSDLKQLLSRKHDGYLSYVESWMTRLRNQIIETSAEQSKIQTNQSLLRKTISKIMNEHYELYKGMSNLLIFTSSQNFLNSKNYQTYNNCKELDNELLSLKNLLFRALEEESKNYLEKNPNKKLYEFLLVQIDSYISLFEQDYSGCLGCLGLVISLPIVYYTLSWLFNNQIWFYGIVFTLITVGIIWGRRSYLLMQKANKLKDISKNLSHNWR